MFDLTKTDDARLKQMAERISNDITELSSALERIRGFLDGTLSPTWEGEAKTAFFDMFRTDFARFDDYVSALRKLNEPLFEAANLYKTSEDRAVDLASSINT